MSADTYEPAMMADQLIARLSSDPSIRLVQRDMIARVAREQELTVLGLTACNR